MTRREAAYERKLQELIDRVGKLTEDEVSRALALLEELRKEVAAQIAGTDWQIYYQPQLKSAVERSGAEFSRRYRDSLSRALPNTWQAGIDQVDWPLNYVGIAVRAPEISMATLEILQGYSADLISGLTQSLLTQVNRELAMGMLGGKSVFQVMTALGKHITDPGIFHSMSARLEAIARTEMGRVNSMSREARIQEVVQADPERAWMKKWISSGKFHPRPNHVALNGVVIPVAKDFSKFGERGPVDEGAGIAYPHAPGLPAGEAINCGCSHVLTLADWEDMPKQWEEIPYQPKAIYD
jgi:hypothetical protein